jgi:hypothetical protein
MFKRIINKRSDLIFMDFIFIRCKIFPHKLIRNNVEKIFIYINLR